MTWRIIFVVFLFILSLPLLAVLTGAAGLGRDWRTTDRSSAGLAPDPTTTPEAVVQVYAARAINWRGIFGVHTWIATKPEQAPEFSVHQVIGWRLWRNLPTVASAPGIADAHWFGSRPEVVAELRGADAAKAIAEIEKAVAEYPYTQRYRLWPGPNSNTFTAYVARRVPELRLDLPVTAIGKDFPVDGFLTPAPSGTGYQISLYGLLGVLLARDEGVELNLFGLSFGIDPYPPALKLPFIGRVGFPRSPRVGAAPGAPSE
jgi:hypothetical protein